MLEPGEIVLIPFPFTNLKGAKQRPALVLSRREFNAEGRDVLLCGLTSDLSNTAHSVLLTGRDMAKGTLVADSRIRPDKIATLQQSIVRRSVGMVKPAILAQVYKELLATLPPSARP